LGLDIQCRCGEIDFEVGSYSYFNLWREKLAHLVGVRLDKLWTLNSLKKRTGKEPFYELLNHSDCDGTLPPSECKRLLEDFDSLKKALLRPKKPKEVWSKLFGNYGKVDKEWMETFEDFHKAVRHSVTKKCSLVFC